MRDRTELRFAISTLLSEADGVSRRHLNLSEKVSSKRECLKMLSGDEKAEPISPFLLFNFPSRLFAN